MSLARSLCHYNVLQFSYGKRAQPERDSHMGGHREVGTHCDLSRDQQ